MRAGTDVRKHRPHPQIAPANSLGHARIYLRDNAGWRSATFPGTDQRHSSLLPGGLSRALRRRPDRGKASAELLAEEFGYAVLCPARRRSTPWVEAPRRRHRPRKLRPRPRRLCLRPLVRQPSPRLNPRPFRRPRRPLPAHTRRCRHGRNWPSFASPVAPTTVPSARMCNREAGA